MLNSHGLALLIDLEKLLDRVCSHSETISADHGPNTSGSLMWSPVHRTRLAASSAEVKTDFHWERSRVFQKLAGICR
jgi:hypothetical protein